MKYKYVLFDLDGTLTDPKEGITRSVQYALRKFNILTEDLDSLEKFIGPPLTDSFMEYYDFSQKQAVLAVEYYREYFRDKGIFENKVYKDIEKLLVKLKNSGLNLIVATSKPTEFSERILKHFNLDTYFSTVIGSNFDGTRCKKDEVINYAIDSCNISDTKEAVMIGDRKYDIVGAQENGIDSIGVTYGYGSLDEIKEARPTYIANSVMNIFEILK